MIWDKTLSLWKKKKKHICAPKKHISDNSSYFLLRVYYVLEFIHYTLYIIFLKQSFFKIRNLRPWNLLKLLFKVFPKVPLKQLLTIW